jgi:xanthine/uracil permease
MTNRTIGLTIVVVGIVVMLVGLLVWAGGLSWFGHLPGDIRYEGKDTKVYVPLTSMLLISVVLSLLVWLARRLF